MKRALIIGAGYIGSALAKQWKNTLDVTTTTTRETRIEELQKVSSKVLILQGNNQEQLREAIKGQDIIVLCVAPGYAPGKKLDYQTTYLDTARNLKDALVNAKDTPYLIYTSSTSVYNKSTPGDLKEDSPSSENPDQQILKKTEETLLELQAIPVCILRLSQIIGSAPRDFVSMAKMMSGRSFPSTGEEFPNVVHVDDIVRAITFAVENHLKGIYNLSQSVRVPRKQIFEKICKDLELEPPVYKADENGHVNRSSVSSKKILQTGFSFSSPAYFEIEHNYKK